MGSYAVDTTVSAERSRAEIETVLMKYGASKFAYMTCPDHAVIAFEANNRRIRFNVPLPSREDFRNVRVKKGRALVTGLYRRSDRDVESIYSQNIRQRWRALLLAVRAKLESVESGIATFEDEFMPYVVLPNGKTVGEWMQPQIAAAYQSGKMPVALLGE